MDIRKRYKLNKTSKVGDKLTCPSCGNSFIKVSYQQAFCKQRPGTKCKDKYWNTVTPNKRNNTDRVSIANTAGRYNLRDIEDTFHPQDPYSLGQE